MLHTHYTQCQIECHYKQDEYQLDVSEFLQAISTVPHPIRCYRYFHEYYNLKNKNSDPEELALHYQTTEHHHEMCDYPVRLIE